MGKELFVGIQAGPHSLMDEGIDKALDLMQETAAINAIMVYGQTYYNTGDRHPDALASRASLKAVGRAVKDAWKG